MAKIRTVNRKIFGKDEAMEVHYQTRLARFFVKIPDYLASFASEIELRDPYVTDANEVQLMVELDKLIKTYEEKSVTERKIIGFALQCSSANNTSNHPSMWAGSEYTRDARISFQYEILIEKTVNGHSRYFKEQSDACGNPFLYQWQTRMDHMQVIEWSPEREEFVKDFYGSMETLIRKIAAFLTTPDGIIQAVDSRMQLLTTTPEKQQ